jgi:hypothetical protein
MSLQVIKLPGQDSNLDKENQNLLPGNRKSFDSETSVKSSLRPERALTKPADPDPSLAKIIRAWPTLPADVKNGIMVLVEKVVDPKAG